MHIIQKYKNNSVHCKSRRVCGITGKSLTLFNRMEIGISTLDCSLAISNEVEDVCFRV